MTSVAEPNPNGEFEPVPQPDSKPDLKIVGGTAHPSDGTAELTGPGTLPIGAKHHRAFVGEAEGYDVSAATQFNIMTFLGLRQHHYLLDIGCGSLRGGRLFISYLEPGRYYGIEPETWLVEEGIASEVGRDMIALKRPVLDDNADFRLTTFDREFDFLLAQSIFSHASRAQIESCLAEARQVMAPEALFAATFVLGEQDYEGEEWVYPGCVTYLAETIQTMANEHGLACRPVVWPHPAQQTWFVFAHEANEGLIPEVDNATRALTLENDLNYARARLAKLENHPYVRLGMKVVGHPMYVKLREATNRLRRAA